MRYYYLFAILYFTQQQQLAWKILKEVTFAFFKRLVLDGFERNKGWVFFSHLRFLFCFWRAALAGIYYILNSL